MNRNVLWVRWLLVALAAILAVVLVIDGNVIVAGLIAAMAIARVVLLVQAQRRRGRWEAWRAARRVP